MRLETRNYIVRITILFVFISRTVDGDFVNSCHAFYNFEGNGPFNNVTNQGIIWTSLPGTAEPCKQRGVLSLYPPSWAQSVEIAITFLEESSGWLFNLGDSPNNNGYGGDGHEQSSSVYDAEIYSQQKSLYMWTNEYGDFTTPYYQNSTSFNKWLVMKLKPGAMATYSDTGLQHNAYTYDLLQFGGTYGTWYLGINRVVNPYNQRYVSGHRTGQGMCSVCIRWTTDQNLGPPLEAPVRPAPGEGPVIGDEEPQSCIETNTCKVCYDFNNLDHNSFVNSNAIKESGVQWAVFPEDTSAPCKAESVLQLTPPEGAFGAEITLTFTGNQRGWVFNLGDSENNNGYGRGEDDNYNAELHANFQQLQIYQSTLSGLDDLTYYRNLTAYKNWLVLKIKPGGMAAFSDLGLSYKTASSYLLQFSSTNKWYLGLNRVVQPIDGSSPAGARSGEGVCSVCVVWNTDGNLNDPQAEILPGDNDQNNPNPDPNQDPQDPQDPQNPQNPQYPNPPNLQDPMMETPNNENATKSDARNKGTKIALSSVFLIFIVYLI